MSVIHLPATHPGTEDEAFHPWLDSDRYHEKFGLVRVIGVHRVVGQSEPVSYTIKNRGRRQVVRELHKYRPRGALLAGKR
jgi:hypothetical protein